MAVGWSERGGWRRCAPMVGFALLLTGCTTLHRGILNSTATPADEQESPSTPLVAEPGYTISCPDEVEVTIAGRKDGRRHGTINSEGRIDLGMLGDPRVEGDTEEALAQRIAELAGVPKEQVHCRVTQFRSRVVYVYGPVKGPPRSIPYRGPETVFSFLRRAGGLTLGAAIRHVYVVRSNVASGEQPRVFAVDLAAIVYQSDPRTNVVLQPFDAVYVGESSRSSLSKALPKWLLPAYHRLCRLWGGCPVELEAHDE